MKSEKWLEICKEMAPHLRALELIAENNALDIVNVALGTETTVHTVWIDGDTGTHYRCTSEKGDSFEAEISNMKADVFEELPSFCIEKGPAPASNQDQE